MKSFTINTLAGLAAVASAMPLHASEQDAGTGLANNVNKDGRIGLVNVGDIASTKAYENKKAEIISRNVDSQQSGTGVANNINKHGKIGLVNVDDVLSSKATKNENVVIVEDNEPV
ncbi:hypothetical protein E4U21_004003, partial [Claviceps maximensis]